jgi:hypothetical protein
VTAATTTMATATAVKSALSSGAVFSGAAMAWISYVALPVPAFIGLKMIEGLISACRQRTSVPATRIITVIDVAIKASTAAKPRPSSEEHSAVEPVWSVVAVRRAVIGRIVVIPIGTAWLHSYPYRHLGSCYARTGK